jgi:hypothetical protein
MKWAIEIFNQISAALRPPLALFKAWGWELNKSLFKKINKMITKD